MSSSLVSGPGEALSDLSVGEYEEDDVMIMGDGSSPMVCDEALALAIRFDGGFGEVARK